MRTDVKLRQMYKEETGNSFSLIEYVMNEITDDNDWNALTVLDYIEWIENKVMDMIKTVEEAKSLHNYKDDYENAEDEIKDLRRVIEE